MILETPFSNSCVRCHIWWWRGSNCSGRCEL